MAVLSATDKNFSSSMKSAGQAMGDLDSSSEKTRSSLLKIATTAVAFKAVDIATNALVSSLDGAISRYDTMNRFPKVMEQIGFSTDESNASIERLSAGIDGLPTSLDGITSSTQSIALLTGDLSSATETALALNNAFLASGASTSDAERGLTQYTQMLSKGKVDMQSWYTLQETMGYALKETAIQLGITSGSTNELYSALQDGSITFDQFNSAMIECSTRTGGFAEVAKTASEGIGTSLQNLQTAVVKNVTNIIDATDQMLADNGWGTLAGNIDGAKGVINTAGSAIASSIGTVGAVVKELSPALKVGAAGWVAYEAAIKISDKVKKTTDAIAKAEAVFKNTQKATELAAKAAELVLEKNKAVEKATKAVTIAESLNAKSKTATIAASKAKASADELAKKAAEARAKAEKVGGLNATLNAQADTAAAAAAAASANASELDAVAKTKKAEAARATVMAQTTETAATTAVTAATAAETTAEEVNAGALTTNSALVAFKTTLMGALAAGEGVATSATLAFNAALKANPIGVTVVAITALAAGMALLVSKFDPGVKAVKKFKGEIKEITDSADDLSNSIETNIKTRDDSIASIKAEGQAAKDLAKKIETLSTKDLENASNKQELQTYIDALNGSVEGLGLAYDEETNSLNMGTDAIQDRINAYTAEAQAQEAAAAYAEVLEEQKKVEEELSAVQEKRGQGIDDNTSKVLTLAGAFNSSLRPATTAATEANEDLKASEEELIAKQGELATQAEELESVISESAALQAAAVEASTTTQINLYDDLADSASAALDRLVEAYSTMTSGLTGLNEELELDTETTWAKVQENQSKALSYTQEFSDLYAQAIKAGVSESYLDAIGVTGPEALPLLRGMMDEGWGEVLNSQSEWESAYKTIGDTFANSLEMGDAERTAISEYVTGSAGILGTLQSQIDSADWSGTGMNIAQGLANGISDNADISTEAAATMADDTTEAAESQLGVRSPSRVFMEIGQYTVQGFILGLTRGRGTLSAAMSSTMQVAIDAAESALSSGLASVVSSAGTSFNKLGTSAKTGMSGMNTAISTGMSTSTRTITTSMQAVNTVIKSGYITAQNAVKTAITAMSNNTKSGYTAMTSAAKNGMNSLVSAITAGMNAANSRVASSNASMVAKVQSLQSSFYASGVYASQGLANGINARAGTAIAAAQSVANRVASIMASALQERSPSKVTRKIGAYASEGLAIGLLEELSYVEKVSKLIANTVSDAINPDMGSISDRLAYAGDFSYTAEVDVNHNYDTKSENALVNAINDLKEALADDNREYTFNITAKAEGREIAKATATYMQEELDKQQRMKKLIAGEGN